MNNENDFRVGFQAFQIMPPSGTPKGIESFKWTMEECERIGARSTCLMPYMIPDKPTADTISEMAGMAKDKDVKIVVYPFTVWGLAGMPLKCDDWGPLGAAVKASKADDIPDAAIARAGVEQMIGLAKALGSDIFCSGYGHLNVATSRYNKDYPYSEQRKFIIANLKEMAKILDGTGITFALENHCDFTGKEIASIIEDVGSKNIMAMYDFGNAAIICADPMEDVDYLAPYAVAGHFKDFKVIMNPHRTKEYPCMPMCTTGCYLGEGFVDFDVILQAIIDTAPNPKGMCLLAEPAFQLPTNDEEKNDRVEFNRKITRQYVAKMKEIVQKF